MSAFANHAPHVVLRWTDSSLSLTGWGFFLLSFTLFMLSVALWMKR